MSYCAVHGCNNFSKKTSGIIYHRFPKDETLCKLWINACGRDDKINVKNARICSEHFNVESYKRDLTKEDFTPITTKNRRNLKPDASPTQKLSKKKEISESRTKRAERKQMKKIVNELIADKDTSTINVSNINFPSTSTADPTFESEKIEAEFPAHMKQAWLSAIGKDPNHEIPHTTVICSVHFKPDDFESYGAHRRLKNESVPSIKLPVDIENKPSTSRRTEIVSLKADTRHLNVETNLNIKKHRRKFTFAKSDDNSTSTDSDESTGSSSHERRARLIKIMHNYSYQVDSSAVTRPSNLFLENNRHLETRITEPDPLCNNAPPKLVVYAPDSQLHTGCVDTMDETAVNEIKNQNFEQIYIKEEHLEESDHEVQDVIVNGIKKEECSDEDEKNCTGVFEIGAHLNKHKKIVDSGIEEFKCSVCQQMFTQKHNLENHIKIHKEIKTFLCFIGVCQKQFTNKFNFERHLQMHDETNDEANKFQCFICNKSFRFKHNLTQHQKMHSGIKEFECHICKKMYLRNRDLKTHLKKHSGVKDFQCQICQKSFTQKCNLKKHVTKIHDEGKEFQCNVCHKLFTRKNNLLMHSKTHADKKYYQCEVCKKLFTRNAALTRHMKKHREKSCTVGAPVVQTHIDNVDEEADTSSDTTEAASIKEEVFSDFEYEELKLDIFKEEKCNNNEICDNY